MMQLVSADCQLSYLVYEICFGAMVMHFGMTAGGHMAINIKLFKRSDRYNLYQKS